jgi:RHS repeat-associated protein
MLRRMRSLQENHYYPFGLSYGGSHWMNDAARDNGYKYNGKELNEDWGLGWYDYGARWYMPDLGDGGRWIRWRKRWQVGVLIVML